MANNFKIFVSRFPTKTAYRRGSVVDVYQISKIVYEEARILESQSLVGELYQTDSGERSPCQGIIGCDEAFVAQRQNCPSGGGSQGPAGPTGPTGPTGPQGPPGDGGARIFCGYLEGPPKPEEGEISLDCLKNATGYVVRKRTTVTCTGSAATNPLANGPINDFKHSFFYGSAGTTGSGGNSELTIDIKTGLPVGSDIAAGPDSCSTLQGGGYQHRTIFNGYKSGGITYRSQQWTFGKYLEAVGKGSSTNRSELKTICTNGGSAAGETGLMFIPTQPIYGGGGSTRLSDWADVVGGDGGNGLYDTLAEDNPDCGPGGPPAAPPIANQGSSICSGGTPPSGSPLPGDENECQGGCSNPIANCSELTDGDIFIDATNGVMYFYSGGAWSNTGVPLGGESDCTKKGSGSDKCKELGGGGGGGGGGPCQCEQCEQCPDPCPDPCTECTTGCITNQCCPNGEPTLILCGGPGGEGCGPGQCRRPDGCGACGSCDGSTNQFNNAMIYPDEMITENATVLNKLLNTLNVNNFDYYVSGTMALEAYLNQSGFTGKQRMGDFDLVIDKRDLKTFNNLVKDNFYLDIITVEAPFMLRDDAMPQLSLISKTNNYAPYFDPIIIPVLLSDSEEIWTGVTIPKPSEFGEKSFKTINYGGKTNLSFKCIPLYYPILQKVRTGRPKDIIDLKVLYFAGLITEDVLSRFTPTDLERYNEIVSFFGDGSNSAFFARKNYNIDELQNLANNYTNFKYAPAFEKKWVWVPEYGGWVDPADIITPGS